MITLSKRPAVYSLPAYSLTSDLLGFLRCGLQYRYTRIGKLPPSRPVQLWFGQFIHGVLEEAFRRFKETEVGPPPWPSADIEEICQLVSRRLAAQGLHPWDKTLIKLSNARAEAAINDLGQDLFPLIHRAEIRLTGARALPMDEVPTDLRAREADRYEVVGVIDVISHIELADPALADNLIVRLVKESLPNELPEAFEVIIDYKGVRRPPMRDDIEASYREIYAWQVQTYAHLRGRQADSLPVVAGALIYTNELLPTWGDLRRIRREWQAGSTDVTPVEQSEAARLLTTMRPRDVGVDPDTGRRELPPKLPREFRVRRATRVIPVTPESMAEALEKFDDVVVRIEMCRGREANTSSGIIASWEKNAEHDQTCAACDQRSFCPEYESVHGGTPTGFPQLPGIKRRN